MLQELHHLLDGGVILGSTAELSEGGAALHKLRKVLFSVALHSLRPQDLQSLLDCLNLTSPGYLSVLICLGLLKAHVLGVLEVGRILRQRILGHLQILLFASLLLDGLLLVFRLGGHLLLGLLDVVSKTLLSHLESILALGFLFLQLQTLILELPAQLVQHVHDATSLRLVGIRLWHSVISGSCLQERLQHLLLALGKALQARDLEQSVALLCNIPATLRQLSNTALQSIDGLRVILVLLLEVLVVLLANASGSLDVTLESGQILLQPPQLLGQVSNVSCPLVDGSGKLLNQSLLVRNGPALLAHGVIAPLLKSVEAEHFIVLLTLGLGQHVTEHLHHLLERSHAHADHATNESNRDTHVGNEE
mmetsp:Transcript_40318/g.96719  ORF Transcript_40318/g.96719 Transcript_40318/m.96719 type:complete len:364 (+) Transcript_40318:959-2050(+)